jgi:hypothetical protein
MADEHKQSAGSTAFKPYINSVVTKIGVRETLLVFNKVVELEVRAAGVGA